MPTTLQALIKSTQKGNGEKPHNEEWGDKRKGEQGNKKEGEEKGSPQTNLRLDHTDQLLKDCLMFNNYFTYYAGFTSIPEGKLPLKFTMPNIIFYGTENPLYHVINFVSTMTLKGITRISSTSYFPGHLTRM